MGSFPSVTGEKICFIPRLLLFLLLSATSCNAPEPSLGGVRDITKATSAASDTTPFPTLPATIAPLTPSIEAASSTASPVTARPGETATPTPTATSHPPATPTKTVAPTSVPWLEREVIGQSVLGEPLEVIRVGAGDRWVILIGALHGGHECNTSALLEGITERFIAAPSLLPEDVTLHIMSVANPDGCRLNTRRNANGVDLNRNWATNDWVTDAEGPAGIVPGSGGATPFSEPETLALRAWLQRLRKDDHEPPLTLISFHSAVVPTGLVQPGYQESDVVEPDADALAKAYAEVTGYRYSQVWVGDYLITGELINWATKRGMVAIDVELPDRNGAHTVPVGRHESHIDTGFRGLMAILAPSS